MTEDLVFTKVGKHKCAVCGMEFFRIDDMHDHFCHKYHNDFRKVIDDEL